MLKAASRALGQFRSHQMAISYRLNHLAISAPRDVAAEAVAAIARLGDPRFAYECYRLYMRMSPKHQALVVARMEMTEALRALTERFEAPVIERVGESSTMAAPDQLWVRFRPR